MTDHTEFWSALRRLLDRHTLVIDRPQGSCHPRFPEFIYPVDYGFLEGTRAGDGKEIDVFRGSLKADTLTGICCTADALKQDIEIKLLYNCSDAEVASIEKALNRGPMSCVVVLHPGSNSGFERLFSPNIRQ